MRTLLLAGAVVVGIAAPAAADEPPRNAALYYWQAFASLPDEKALTDEERKRVEEEWEAGPLDAVTEAALKKYADALVYFHRGAACPACTWASAYDLPRDGIGTRITHLSRAWKLRSAVLLRARWRFAHGPADRAVDDLIALARFGRHVERGGSLIGVLLSAGGERHATAVLGANLWAVMANRQSVVALRAKLDAVPAPRPMTDALSEEKDALIGMFRHHARLTEADLPDDELNPIGFVPTLKHLVGLETREQAVETLCSTIDRHYTRFIRATDVPPDRVLAAEKRFLDNWPRTTLFDDPIAAIVARQLFPAVGKLRLTEAEMKTRRAMLRAALAVADKGAGELAGHPDPFTGKPFPLKRFEGGFELASPIGELLNRQVMLSVRTAKPAE